MGCDDYTPTMISLHTEVFKPFARCSELTKVQATISEVAPHLFTLGAEVRGMLKIAPLCA